MNLSKCPQCGARLGNFLYADACPHCHVELRHNTQPLISLPPVRPSDEAALPFRVFRQIVRLVES